MSKINGEKARANVAKRRRTAQRLKDRTALAQLKSGKPEESAPKAAGKSKSR